MYSLRNFHSIGRLTHFCFIIKTCSHLLFHILSIVYALSLIINFISIAYSELYSPCKFLFVFLFSPDSCVPFQFFFHTLTSHIFLCISYLSHSSYRLHICTCLYPTLSSYGYYLLHIHFLSTSDRSNNFIFQQAATREH